MTKKTHIIYIAVILILLGTTAWWINHSYEHSNAAGHYTQHVKDHPLLDPALPFYEKENLIVNVQELREYLKALPEQNTDWADMSIYFEVLNTGANITVNSNLKIWPASLAKLPVGMIAMKKVEKGDWSLDGTKLTLVKEDADSHTIGVEKMIGQSFTLQFLLERLLLESDNTAYHMLVRELSEEELISIANAVGLEEFFTKDQKVSAKDYSRLLRALYSSTYLDENHSQELLGLLQNSKFNKFIKAGIPSDVEFAHKWGINDQQDVYADAGIMYIENRPVLISVMVQGKSGNQPADQGKAEKLIKEIGEHAYNFISSR